MIKSLSTKFRIKIRQRNKGKLKLLPAVAAYMRSVIRRRTHVSFSSVLKTKRIKAYIAARALSGICIKKLEVG